MKITRFAVEELECGCVTDNPHPRFSFACESEKKGVNVESAVLSVNNWTAEMTLGEVTEYGGEKLEPYTRYEAVLSVIAGGEKAEKKVAFETGKLGEKFVGRFITCGDYTFTEKGVSPVPMTFRKNIEIPSGKKLKRARIYSTALGIYFLTIDNKRVGEDYFAPGFTSYKHTLMYQTYDVTELLREGGTLTAVVGGGWAVGSFVFTRKNRVTAPRQAFMADVLLEYEDGGRDIIGTDSSFSVTMNGNYRMSDFYDGETFDARVDLDKIDFKAATLETVKISPRIVAAFGSPVIAHEFMKPVSCSILESGELVYDFGQNFAGVVKARIKGKDGQTIVFRHAEILNQRGELNVALLRSAKQTATYICKDGEQEYSPMLTYMGFRYVGVSGVEKENIELSAVALYSDLETIGEFSCSDERLNRLQQNILWSAKSNFMDIPTDCPQRDERMGWTGDIAVFAPTACFNFGMTRFLEKWLADVKDEQLKTGGIPNTVPVQGYGFPATMPVMAVAWWGDACILVPYTEYMTSGNKAILEKMYPTMKKYVKACKFWAGFLSFGKRRYIWNTPAVLHFGDWIAPDVDKMSAWQKRRTYTATASLANTSAMLSKIAGILGKEEDKAYYAELSEKVKVAFRDCLTDGKGRVKEEFQTAYVLPLHFDIFTSETKQKAAENLMLLVSQNDYKIGTGFPGTPFILFALSDNGFEDGAFRMLMNEKCPSWLHEVKAGGTTVWERWDGLKADGTLNAGEGDGTGGMISFNHYASGAVGDFLYRRIVGIEATSPGYKTSRIKPLIGGGLTSAKGRTRTPFGEISCEWKVSGGKFDVKVKIPLGTECELFLPSGEKKLLESGIYDFEESYVG